MLFYFIRSKIYFKFNYFFFIIIHSKGLNYDKFLESLLRIAIKKKIFLEDVGENYQSLYSLKTNNNNINNFLKEINFTEITVNKLLIDEYPELEKQEEIKEFGFIRSLLSYITGEKEKDLKNLLLKRLENFKIAMDGADNKNISNKFSSSLLQKSLIKGFLKKKNIE